MGMNYVKIHLDALLAYRRLTDTEFGRAIRCVLQYMEDGTDPNLDGKVGIMYDVLREQVDRDRKAYDKRVAAQTENGKKGGRPRKNTAHGQYPKEPNETHQNPWVFEKPNETQKTQEKEEEYIPPCIPPAGGSGGGGFMTLDEAETLSAGLDTVFDEAERCGFSRSQRVLDELNALCAEYTPPCVLDAIRIAHDRGKPNLGYLRGVLQRGVDTQRESPRADPADPTGGLGWL